MDPGSRTSQHVNTTFPSPLPFPLSWQPTSLSSHCHLITGSGSCHGQARGYRGASQGIHPRSVPQATTSICLCGYNSPGNNVLGFKHKSANRKRSGRKSVSFYYEFELQLNCIILNAQTPTSWANVLLNNCNCFLSQAFQMFASSLGLFINLLLAYSSNTVNIVFHICTFSTKWEFQILPRDCSELFIASQPIITNSEHSPISQ